MGMPVEFNTMIVTKGKEQRIEKNEFRLKKEGYRVYPLHIPLEVRKTKEGEVAGTAVVQSLHWENNETEIVYELISLQSVN